MADRRIKNQGIAPTVPAGLQASNPTLPLSGHSEKYPAGHVLDQFTIEDFIAEGGFGSVYRAVHPRHGKVALKVAHTLASNLSTACFALHQNELEAVLQLRHRSLVPALDYGVVDNRHYLAFEFIEGESLRGYMGRRGRVDVIEAIALMRQLAEAIAYCHDNNVCHLDLTPNNVIVVDPYVPDLKIVDFGVAAFGENWLDVARRPTVGTPLYMAPELLENPPQIGPSSDVYALGLIFYELLAGTFPFRTNGSWEQLRAKKLEGDMRPITAYVPALPEAVAATVHGLLYAEPARRMFTAGSLAAHLRDLYFDILSRSDGTNRNRNISIESPTQTAIVGREHEITTLLERAAQADRDTGCAIAIVGEAGIGKSRILAELTARLQLGGWMIGYGRCRKHNNVASYSVWRECIGQLADILLQTTHPDDALRITLADSLADPTTSDLATLVPELRALTSTRSSYPTLSRETDVGSAVVSHAIKRFVAAVADHVPVALVIEDAHWADPGTMEILDTLVSSPQPRRVMILVTVRPEAVLPASPLLDRFPLAPLDSSQGAELLRALAGNSSKEVISELQNAIPLLRLGNPLVNTQVMLQLKREGILQRDAEGKVVLAQQFDAGYAPPTSVASVLERRLRNLPQAAIDVLGIASLVGRQFSVADIKQIAAPDLDAASVDDAVLLAQELALCKATDDTCCFVHDLIRDHLETTVAVNRIPRLHARIARTLRGRVTPATLAYHLDRAGDSAAAAASYFEAANEADRAHDPAGASRHLRRALQLYHMLAPSSDRDRELARTTYELARITGLLGKTDDSLEELNRCRDAMVAPPQDALVMLHSAYARVHYAQGDFKLALEYSERCLAVTDAALGPYQCVPANMLGRAQCASGHFGASIEVLRRGCRLARDAGNLVELAHSTGLLGTSLAFVGEFEESARQIAESSGLADALGDRTRRMGVCLYQTLSAEAAGRWEDGIETSARMLALAEQYSMAGLYLYFGTLMAGRHHFHIGELQRARHLLRNAINFSKVFGIRIASSWAHAYLGDVCFVEGKHEEALRWYATGRELARDHQDGFGLPLSLIGMAHAFAYLDVEVAQTHKLADEAFDAFEASSNITSLAVGLVRYLDALGGSVDDPGKAEGANQPPKPKARIGTGTGAPRSIARELALSATKAPSLHAGWESTLSINEHCARTRARLSQLLDRLDVTRCEFWPMVPEATGAGTNVSPAQYWQHRAATEFDQAVTRPASGDSLLVSLATVDGFIPAFAAP